MPSAHTPAPCNSRHNEQYQQRQQHPSPYNPCHDTELAKFKQRISHLPHASPYNHTSSDELPIAVPVYDDPRIIKEPSPPMTPTKTALTPKTKIEKQVVTPTNTSNEIPIRHDLGRQPKPITCPYCHKHGWTEVTDEKVGPGWIGGVRKIVKVFSEIGARETKDTVHRCFYCREIVGRTEAFEELGFHNHEN
mmetsp:Transcript_20010/g.24724  ORF Transcript_20010/g.24724 Transcript_20010/m.24724 type:complete len:192 (+) Transcript_20010:64-639(+)